jgi:hypothetical protein
VPNFRTYINSIAPPWFRGEWGERLWGMVGLYADLVAEGCSQAVKAHLLNMDTSPPDALPVIGSGRDMPRYPGETDAQYRSRLWDAWDAYVVGGTEAAITGQLAEYGLSNTRCISQHDGWRFEIPPTGSEWSRFVVVIEQTHSWATAYTYGTGYSYGTAMTYGSAATPDDVATVKGIIMKWKPAHSRNPYILLIIDHEYYGDPDLDYGAAGVVYGADVARWDHQL